MMVWTIIWDDKSMSRIVTEYNSRDEALEKAAEFGGAGEIFATVKGDIMASIKFQGLLNER